MSDTRAPIGPPDRSELMAALAPFQVPCLRRSVWQFTSTFIGYAVSNIAMYGLVDYSAWIACIIALPAAGFLVRLFIIQHDCGHGSFFRSRGLNDVLGCF